MDATYYYYFGPIWPLPPHALLGREVGYGILAGLCLLVGVVCLAHGLAGVLDWWQERR